MFASRKLRHNDAEHDSETQVTIYHAPKVKELQLNGMEGVVKNIVKKYKGKETSANLPYRIEFVLEKEDGKQQKFFAHMVGFFPLTCCAK